MTADLLYVLSFLPTHHQVILVACVHIGPEDAAKKQFKPFYNVGKFHIARQNGLDWWSGPISETSSEKTYFDTLRIALQVKLISLQEFRSLTRPQRYSEKSCRSKPNSKLNPSSRTVYQTGNACGAARRAHALSRQSRRTHMMHCVTTGFGLGLDMTMLAACMVRLAGFCAVPLLFC